MLQKIIKDLRCPVRGIVSTVYVNRSCFSEPVTVSTLLVSLIQIITEGNINIPSKSPASKFSLNLRYNVLFHSRIW